MVPRHLSPAMPKHICIDPQDPYAQREVVIEFEGDPLGIHLVTALDEWDVDILPDLVEEQRKDLRREIAVYYNFCDPYACMPNRPSDGGSHT